MAMTTAQAMVAGQSELRIQIGRTETACGEPCAALTIYLTVRPEELRIVFQEMGRLLTVWRCEAAPAFLASTRGQVYTCICAARWGIGERYAGWSHPGAIRGRSGRMMRGARMRWRQDIGPRIWMAI